jgi:NADH-quinone oxidoreductase subunit M
MIAVLLILIPLLSGLAAFFIRNEKNVKTWALMAAFASLAVSLAGLWLVKEQKYFLYHGEWLQILGSSFSVKLDGMGQVLCLLTAVSFPLILIATWKRSYTKPNNFFALMLLTQAGLMGVFLAMDALLFYFFWELALIPVYFLCSQWGGERRIAVTFKFFVYTFLGSLLMLVGILYLQSKTPGQSFSLAAFYELQLQLSKGEQLWLFWLFFIAFAVKMPIFPFHTWQPDTYQQSPVAVTMVLSGIMVKMGLAGLIRWLMPVLTIGAETWSYTVIPLALAGIIYASLIALRQDDIKKLVAYSSIAHIGLMCVAVFASNATGMQGVMIQLFSHGVNIIGLWIAVEFIERKTGITKISELGGLATKTPSLAIFFVIMALANIALPLTNAFPGEFLMFNAIFRINSPYALWFTIAAGAGVILGAAYTLRMIRKVFYGETGTAGEAISDIGWNEKLALAVIAGLIFWLGFYPQAMLNLTEYFSGNMIEKINTIKFLAK